MIEYKCKFCNKLSRNKSGNTFHEKRCKLNPNRYVKNKQIFVYKDSICKCIFESELQKYIDDGWIRGKLNNSNLGGKNKNKISITDGINNKYIFLNELNLYINLGWRKGFTIRNRKKSLGRAATIDKEIERRLKISHTMKNNSVCGGYRKGSGRGKSGWYKGIYCDSTWELAFVIYHLDNNLKIERCKEYRKYIFNNKEHIYIPDFVTDDGIIEIKGYITDQWKAKIKYNPDVKVLYKDDIIKYIEYCKNKYNCDLIKLYD